LNFLCFKTKKVKQAFLSREKAEECALAKKEKLVTISQAMRNEDERSIFELGHSEF